MFLPFVLPRCTGGLDTGLGSTPYLPCATLHLTFWHRHLQKCLVFLCPDAWDGLGRKKHLHNSMYPIGLLTRPTDEYLLQARHYSQNTFLQRSSVLPPSGFASLPPLPSPLHISSRPQFPITLKGFLTTLLLFWIPLIANQLWGKSRAVHSFGDQTFIFGKGIFASLRMLPREDDPSLCSGTF